MAFYIVAGFINQTININMCVTAGLILIGCIALQWLFQNLADHLQSATGFEIFADKRIELGKHLRKLPMGFYSEGNIGRISSVLSTDMLFIEEKSDDGTCRFDQLSIFSDSVCNIYVRI